MIFPNIIICRILVFVDDKTLIVLKSMLEFEIFFFGEYKNRFYQELIEYMYPELIYLKENYEWENFYSSIYLANNMTKIKYKEIFCINYSKYLTLKILDHRNLLKLNDDVILDKIITFIINNDDLDYLEKFITKYKIKLNNKYATHALYKNKIKILEYLKTLNLNPDKNMAKMLISYDLYTKEIFLKKKLLHTKREDECN